MGRNKKSQSRHNAVPELDRRLRSRESRHRRADDTLRCAARARRPRQPVHRSTRQRQLQARVRRLVAAQHVVDGVVQTVVASDCCHRAYSRLTARGDRLIQILEASGEPHERVRNVGLPERLTDHEASLYAARRWVDDDAEWELAHGRRTLTSCTWRTGLPR